MKKRTHEQFLQELYQLYGDDYEVLENYVTARTPIRVKHIPCGKIYQAIPDVLLRGSKCRECATKEHGLTRRKKQDAFLIEVKNLVGDEYKVLGNYTGAQRKVLFKHNIVNCQHEFEMLPSNFIHQEQRCPKCADANKGSYLKKTKDEVQQYIFDNISTDFQIISNYIGHHSPITIKHNTLDCNHEFTILFSNFLRRGNCPKCQGKWYNRTTEDFQNQVDKLTEGEYTVIGDFVDTRTHIEILHNSCGNSWNIVPSSFLGGVRCPVCKASKGEEVVNSYLRKNKITFHREHRFDDCKNERSLPFDFIIFKNNTPIMAIEFHGKQHYEPIDHFGGEEQYKYQQHNDNIKRNYCKENNIKLLEIPYWEFDNIEEILNKHIVENRQQYVS